jgi:hypothetical protein
MLSAGSMNYTNYSAYELVDQSLCLSLQIGKESAQRVAWH